MQEIIEKQREFQQLVGFPIDSSLEKDRNDLSEKYVFKLIEEAIEFRKEFPSVMNPWAKVQKSADPALVQKELSDVFLFFLNILITWRFDFNKFLITVQQVQDSNFTAIKQKKLDILNHEILSVPGHVSGIGSGSINPRFIIIGLNPSKTITHGYKFWSNPEDDSSKILLPILESIGLKEFCYFTNIVKSTTHDNSQPTEEQLSFWSEFLQRELDILKINNPRTIHVSLGSVVKEKLPQTINIPHPAYVLRGGMSQSEYEEEIKTTFSPYYRWS